MEKKLKQDGKMKLYTGKEKTLDTHTSFVYDNTGDENGKNRSAGFAV